MQSCQIYACRFSGNAKLLVDRLAITALPPYRPYVARFDGDKILAPFVGRHARSADANVARRANVEASAAGAAPRRRLARPWHVRGAHAVDLVQGEP